MKSLRHERDRFSVLAIAAVATIASVLAVTPAVTSAASTMSLGVEPAIPSEGKPFQVIAQGTRESPSGGSQAATYLNVAAEPCGSTEAFEGAKDEGREIASFSFEPNGPYDLRGIFQGSVFAPYAVDSGLITGKYRICGYISDKTSAGGAPPLAAARLDFTVGGTCASATAKVPKVEGQLKKAKAKLSKAGETNVKVRIKKTQRKVKLTRAKLKVAKEDRKALC